jgi:hypothetical protein
MLSLRPNPMFSRACPRTLGDCAPPIDKYS